MDNQHTISTRRTPLFDTPIFGKPLQGFNRSPNHGYLIEYPDGWHLYTARGNCRGILRKSHGWTQETADEALRLQEGDVLP